MNFTLLAARAAACLIVLTPDATRAADDAAPRKPEAAPPAAAAFRDVTVRRYSTSTLTDADADRILGEANAVLSEVNGTGDVACVVNLRRQGGVTEFADGDGEIDTAEEFDQVIKLPGNIKVVNAINWCGRPSSNVIGCAPVPGNSLVVVRFDPQGRQEGILWAHEYGHNRGLRHRDAADNEVMNSVVASTHTHVNADEKAAYESEQAAVRPGPPEAAGKVREFVRKRYIEGLPYEQAVKFGPEDVPVLIEMLTEAEGAAYRPNVVTLLGIIGDPRAVGPLIKVVEEGEGVLSPTEYAAKKSALVFLGDLVNKSNDKKALGYLVAGASTPDVWTKRVKWSSPFTKDEAQRNWQLTKSSVWGLAASGKPEALEAIRTLQGKLKSDAPPELAPAMKPVPADVSGVLNEATAALKTIREKGLRTFRTAPHDH